jgi:hypothetical protein
VAEGEGPEFEPPYKKKKREKNKYLQKKWAILWKVELEGHITADFIVKSIMYYYDLYKWTLVLKIEFYIAQFKGKDKSKSFKNELNYFHTQNR